MGGDQSEGRGCLGKKNWVTASSPGRQLEEGAMRASVGKVAGGGFRTPKGAQVHCKGPGQRANTLQQQVPALDFGAVGEG